VAEIGAEATFEWKKIRLSGVSKRGDM